MQYCSLKRGKHELDVPIGVARAVGAQALLGLQEIHSRRMYMAIGDTYAKELIRSTCEEHTFLPAPHKHFLR